MHGVLLYLPGFLILKAARQSYIASLLFAPPITLAIYGVFEIVLSRRACSAHGRPSRCRSSSCWLWCLPPSSSSVVTSVRTSVREIRRRHSDYEKDKTNPKRMTSLYAFYEISDWEGIDSVTDETPGFTPILSEGDMRLYKISAQCQ